MKIILTEDGSHTLLPEGTSEHYHSIKGARTESQYVFIEQGFQHLPAMVNPVRILEAGFGSGLNALLTWDAAQSGLRRIHYVGLETRPLEKAIWSKLNHPDFMSFEAGYKAFQEMHLSSWDTPVFIGEHFVLHKLNQSILDVTLKNGAFHLVYFDLFSFEVNPDLWGLPVFDKLYRAMAPGGILVTYAAKGEIRRTMEKSGFQTARLNGPPGKREMLRATKTHS
jgi:tRNA U34 5-methylaminomethyl-2-thiouridine-forming methyltransferase MnmC